MRHKIASTAQRAPAQVHIFPGNKYYVRRAAQLNRRCGEAGKTFRD
jgi:hypothetical protein